MAFRRTRSTRGRTGRSTTRTRSTGRRAAPSRRSSGRRVGAGGQTLRLVIETVPATGLSRDIGPLQKAMDTRRGKARL